MKHLFTCIVLTVATIAIAADGTTEKSVKTQQFRPKWKIGDRWTVETQSRQPQVASPEQERIAAHWRFAVEAVDNLQGKPCWRIVIRPVQAEEPKTTVWIDQATTAIRQIETQLPTPDGYKTVIESYQSATAAPVVGPLSVLPIAIPQFPEPGIKSLDTYEYETISGPGGVKAVGDVGFSTEIHQSFSTPSAQQMKGILGDEHMKGLEDRPLIEVDLSTPDEKVRQIWSAGSPWPLFIDNDTTQARLVSSTNTTRKKGGKSDFQSQNRADGQKQITPVDHDRIKSLQTRDGYERGVAGFKPWSGSWWPMRAGGLLIPLSKYDRLTGHRAVAWEHQHNPPGPDVPYWFGYCHAWAAASILEKEPVVARLFRLTSSRLGLGIGDQKGLLTACHTQDLANSWGDRYGDGQGNEDPQDLRPDRLWRLLKLHLGQQGVPLVLDVEADKEVWNYPIYDYEISYSPTSGGLYLANLTLLMADDAVATGYRGTKTRKQTYQFAFKKQGSNVISGSGRWIGRSKADHPDFAWYPYKAVAQNPEVKYPKVKKLVDQSQSPPTTPVQPSTPPNQPTVPSTPQPEPTLPAEPVTPDAPVVLSPVELVALIANRTSSFEFDSTLDRFDGATYSLGETYFMRVKSEQPGYLYLIHVDSTGTPSLLYPTAGEDNRIPGGKLVEVRPYGSASGFAVSGPPGIVRIKAVVTSRPLAFSGSLETLVESRSQQQTQQNVSSSGEQIAQPQNTTQKQDTPVSRQTSARPVQFRWHPTQRHQIKKMLSQNQLQTTAAALGCRKPQELLGPFAQDMTTFYIDTNK